MRFGYSEDFCPWLYLKLHNVVSSYEIHDEFKRLPSPITCKTMLLISQKCYLFGKECALAKKSLHHFGHQTSWKPSKQTSWDSSVWCYSLALLFLVYYILLRGKCHWKKRQVNKEANLFSTSISLAGFCMISLLSEGGLQGTKLSWTMFPILKMNWKKEHS